MRILLILGSNPSLCPYLQYYISALEKYNCEYDVVYWNKRNIDEVFPENYFKLKNNIKFKNNVINKAFTLWNMRRFVMRTISKNKYERIVIFNLQAIPLYYKLIRKQYKNKCIIDIRDYSDFYEYPVIKYFIDKGLRNSFANCISSPGFKRWLPNDIKYTLSHNIHQSHLPYKLEVCNKLSSDQIRILTIGKIRDIEENYQLIKRIANNNHFVLTFIGIGDGIKELERRVKSDNISNVFFRGKYDKSEELDIVKQFDMINSYMPNDILSNSLMSNRIYLSLLTGKPIIVSSGSTQSDYVDKYNLGISVKDINNIEDAITNYWTNFNHDLYLKGRTDFLCEIQEDVARFESVIKEFIDNTK